MQAYQKTLQQALQLPTAECIALMQALAASFAEAAIEDSDEPLLSAEEVTALMTVDPLPPSEIIRQGLTGTWADVGDGAAWVNARKTAPNDFTLPNLRASIPQRD